MHSVELLLDPKSESAVRRVWDELADLGLPSRALHPSPCNRPHVTLLTCAEPTDSVRARIGVALGALPLPATLARPVRYGGRSRVVAWALGPCDVLSSLHLAVWRAAGAENPLHHPARWEPHVTLARSRRPAEAWQEKAWRTLRDRPPLRVTLTGARTFDSETGIAEDLTVTPAR